MVDGADIQGYFDRYISKDNFAFDDFLVRLEGPERIKNLFQTVQDRGVFTATLLNIKVMILMNNMQETWMIIIYIFWMHTTTTYFIVERDTSVQCWSEGVEQPELPVHIHWFHGTVMEATFFQIWFSWRMNIDMD